MLFSQFSMALLRGGARGAVFRRTSALRIRPAVRKYASAIGGDSKARSSDLPWIVGSTAITVIGSYYLLTTGSRKSHHVESHKHESPIAAAGHEDHDGKHAAVTEHGSDKGSTKGGEEEGDVAPVADEHVDEKGDERGDGEVNDGVSEGGQEQRPSSEPSLIDSPVGGGDNEPAVDPAQRDPPDTQKESGSFNTTSGKQEGLSNNDTVHPKISDTHGPQLSNKSEGVSETAKLKGTVDVDRATK